MSHPIIPISPRFNKIDGKDYFFLYGMGLQEIDRLEGYAIDDCANCAYTTYETKYLETLALEWLDWAREKLSEGYVS